MINMTLEWQITIAAIAGTILIFTIAWLWDRWLP